ncbi:efflux RND transporter periplasmic adaptor subunit [Pseudooceanicola sp. HF7]|uniref:efflux RND transporter periplasmic adaptor subunit n=1 Tax=Pseudooceanicola sp. HF7 TaxID=2721560 RepID=UPI00143029E3|nr:efflux RND transporter periplasmic adaptor subunit [Pseudooceanicola sp. HF7]NIZ08093.1 efflux RND transporter periplasmic adaptor subunit [Pseudooceanicola sp. HF7]
MKDSYDSDVTALAMAPPARLARRRRAPILALCIAGLLLAIVVERYVRPRTVATIAVSTADQAIRVSGPGTLASLTDVRISSRVNGVILKLAVEEGDRVSAGDTLVRLDETSLAADHDVARATIEVRQAEIRKAQADITRAASVLNSTRRNLDRRTRLFASTAGSQLAVDDAKADLEAARADHSSSLHALEAARAMLKVAQAEDAAIQSALEQLRIAAPIAGLVVSRSESAGAVVSVGQEILRVVQPEAVVIRTRFDEGTISRLQPGQPAAARIGGQRISGEVLRVGRHVDAETREFTVDIRPKTLPRNWAIGQRAWVEVTVDRQTDVQTVPDTAIAWKGGEQGLWLVRNGRASFRPIDFSETGTGRVILATQLPQDARVILPEGPLYPRMPVRSEAP